MLRSFSKLSACINSICDNKFMFSYYFLVEAVLVEAVLVATLNIYISFRPIYSLGEGGLTPQ